MARGRIKSYDDLIMELDTQIKKTKFKMDQQIAEREKLLNLKRESEIKELYDLIKSSGISVEEVAALISGKETEQIA